MKLRIIPHRGKEMKGRWVAIVDGKELFGGETLELEGRTPSTWSTSGQPRSSSTCHRRRSRPSPNPP
jgi:hypothetical protein